MKTSLLVLLTYAVGALAASKVYEGACYPAAGYDVAAWDDAANWGGSVPVAGDDVTVDCGDSSYTWLFLATDVNINSLTMARNSRISSLTEVTLTIASSMDINVYNRNDINSLLTIVLDVGSTWIFTLGTDFYCKSIVNRGTGELYSSVATSVNWRFAGTAEDGGFRNEATGTVTLTQTTHQFRNHAGDPYFVNDGTVIIDVNPANGVLVYIPFINNGELDIRTAGGNHEFDAPSAGGAGRFECEGGTVKINALAALTLGNIRDGTLNHKFGGCDFSTSAGGEITAGAYSVTDIVANQDVQKFNCMDCTVNVADGFALTVAEMLTLETGQTELYGPGEIISTTATETTTPGSTTYIKLHDQIHLVNMGTFSLNNGIELNTDAGITSHGAVTVTDKGKIVTGSGCSVSGASCFFSLESSAVLTVSTPTAEIAAHLTASALSSVSVGASAQLELSGWVEGNFSITADGSGNVVLTDLMELTGDGTESLITGANFAHKTAAFLGRPLTDDVLEIGGRVHASNVILSGGSGNYIKPTRDVSGYPTTIFGPVNSGMSQLLITVSGELAHDATALHVMGTFNNGGGDVIINTVGGFLPAPNQTYEIVRYSSAVGEFGNIRSEPTLPGTWTPTYYSTSVVVTYCADGDCGINFYCGADAPDIGTTTVTTRGSSGSSGSGSTGSGAPTTGSGSSDDVSPATRAASAVFLSACAAFLLV